MSVEFKAAENLCTVEGILSEVNLKEGTSEKTKKNYIMGEVKIKTTVDIKGVAVDLEVPVRVFANQMTNKGVPNPAYESIKRIGEYVSLASCGGDYDKADRVRFENANIRSFEY